MAGGTTSRSASSSSASRAALRKSRRSVLGRQSLKFKLEDVPSVGSIRNWSFGRPASAEKNEDFKNARDFSRNMQKRKTHIIVKASKTCFPTRFRPMKEKEYELKVEQQQAEKLIARERKQNYKKKDRFKSFAAQRASVRKFLNDTGFRKSITGTFLDNSDAFRRKRDKMEEAEPEPPSDEVIEEEKKVDEDNAWIVKTLESHDTREDLEQRVIQNIMQDPRLFRILRNTLRVNDANRVRHFETQHKQLSDLELVYSSAELMKETELGLAQDDMRERLFDLHCALETAQSNRIPKYAPIPRSCTPTSMGYWESDERYIQHHALEKELLSDLRINRFGLIAMKLVK